MERLSLIFANGKFDFACYLLSRGLSWIVSTKLTINVVYHTLIRIALENATSTDSERPKKRRRLARGVQGVHAVSLEPVTPTNVDEHQGWYTTPLGRLIRPMRMRPARPLDPPIAASTALGTKGSKQGKPEAKERKKRKVLPDTRARRKTIDPIKYGSTHVIGAFLGAEVQLLPEIPTTQDAVGSEDDSNGDKDSTSTTSSSSDEEDEEAPSQAVTTSHQPMPPQTPIPPLPAVTTASILSKPDPQGSVPIPTSAQPVDSTTVEFTAEKLKSLDLLRSMFGEKDDDTDWGGAESVSDVDMESPAARSREGFGDGNVVDYEEVGRSGTPKPSVRGPGEDGSEDGAVQRMGSSGDEEDTDENEDESEDASDSDLNAKKSVRDDAEQSDGGTQTAERQPGVQMTKLKDLFAPREEEGSSIVLHSP